MDAHTTFDREPVRVRHRYAVDPVPLFERTWFQLAGSAVIVSWVAACFFMLAWLVK